ncbi:MAG TPA: PAS domain S-box protein [Planctomycetota bacterium]|nr:PAS domain S-box protein [Planctomycetota bacterium]
MRMPRQGHRIVWLVRLLTAVSVLLVAVNAGLIGWKLSAVRRNRERAAVEQRQMDEVAQDLRERIVDNENHLQAVLNERAEISGLKSTDAGVIEYIRAHFTAQAGPIYAGQLEQFNPLIGRLDSLTVRANGWRAQYDDVLDDLKQQRSVGGVRDLILKMHAAVESRIGEGRINEAVLLKRWRAASGDEASRLAQTLVKLRAGALSARMNDVQNALSDLSRLVELLGGEEQLDNFADIRENKLEPALRNLKQSVAAYGAVSLDQVDFPPRSVEELETALFGPVQGHANSVRPGGLFALRHDALRLREEQIELRSQLTALFDKIEAVGIAFDKAVQSNAEALTGQLELGFASVWRQLMFVGGGCLVLLLVLAILISRGVRGQVTALEIARANAESGRLSAQRSMLSQQVAVQDRLNLETRLSKLAGTAPGILYAFRRMPDGKYCMPYASPKLEEFFGVKPEEVTDDASRAFARVHPEDLGPLLASIERSAQSTGYWTHIFRTQHRTKGTIWIEGRSQPERQPDGSTLWHGFLLDVTQRKQAEEKLNLFRALVDRSFDSIEVIHPETGRFLDVNEKACAEHGYARDELLALTVFDIDAQLNYERFRKNDTTLRSTKRMSFESMHRRKDGTTFPVEVNVTLVQLDREYLVAAVRDITDRKRADAQRERLAALVEASTDFIGFADPKTMQIQYINSHGRRMCGIGKDEDLSKIKINDVHPDWMNKRITEVVLPAADRDGFWEGEGAFLRRDGREIPVLMTLQVLKAANGEADIFYTVSRDITERKQAEEAAHLQSTALNAAGNAIVITNREGMIVWSNPAFTTLTGYALGESVGKNPRDLVKSGRQDPAVYRQMWETILSGRTWWGQLENRRKDGSYYHEEQTITPVRGPDGEITHFIAIKQDLTERKQAEEDSKQRNTFIETILENAPIGFGVNTIDDGKAVFVSHKFESIYGVSAGSLGSVDDFFEKVYTDPKFRAEMRARVVADMASGDPSRMRWENIPITTAEGEQRIVTALNIPLVEQNLMISTVQDVTERWRAEYALRESELRLRKMLENLKLIAMTLDKKGTITFCNDYLLQLTGWTHKDVIGTNWFEKFIPESDVATKKLFFDTIENGEIPAHHENPIRTRAGELRMVFWNNTMLRDAAGNVTGVASIAEDITERKESELALRESEARFRQFAENIEEVFWMSSPASNQILYVSPAYEKIWGRPCDALYQSPRTWLEAIHPDDRDQIQQAAATKQDRGEYDETYRVVRPDGSLRWIHDRAFPIRNAAGEVYRIVGTASDITAQRNLEQQFRQSQKMEAFGLLAGGVAHDFNNLLGVVIGYCDIWLMKLPADAPIRNPLKSIKHAGERASALTKQLLAFSRQTVLEPKILDLNTVVRETEKMLGRLIGEDIQFMSILDPAIPRVKVDPGQIGQVLLNLAVNARDAMPQGGSLTIETGTAKFDAAYVRAHPGAQLGRQVMLSVSDTGCGMSPEIMARIFEPFFTTKGVGKGTGLGLAVVHGVVMQSGGTIEVESKLGAGTTFKLYFPMTLEQVQSADRSGQMIAQAGVETILVVEDETNLREMIDENLCSLGYHVLTARNGNEALEIVRANEGQIDLMLTDVVMPGISGRELADTLEREERPMNVLFMSGYTDDAVVRHGIHQEKVAFLQKPFAPFELLKKIRQVLDAGAAHEITGQVNSHRKGT